MTEISQTKLLQTAEYKRLQYLEKNYLTWEKWGPYVSDRSWGSVREDYSKDGDAWNYFPFDHAHFRAFRWGDDAIAGFCDRYQTLIFSFAFWNGKDPILKERLFGLTPNDANHGEDVKEHYYHLEATPTHSYLKFLYKYPQNAFPYQDLIDENRKRGGKDREYELVDTKIFDNNEYFDIEIEYAKKSIDDICIKLTVFNRAEKQADLHILPQIWFRNLWQKSTKKPSISIKEHEKAYVIVCDDKDREPIPDLLFDYRLSERYLYGPKEGSIWLCENETNTEKLQNVPNTTSRPKDSFAQKLIEKKEIDLSKPGTKGCFCQKISVPGGQSKTLIYRLADQFLAEPFEDIEKVFVQRKLETEEFYKVVCPEKASEEEKLVQRRAFAGLIWSKMVYLFDVGRWLEGDDPTSPPPEERKHGRNFHWRHLNSKRVLSMPDKWEYPWFAAWDLAFHCIGFSLFDVSFAKEQLWFLLFDQFLHPNGQVPAYEWEFSDVNPPVQGWACLKVLEAEKKFHGTEDLAFLEKCFHKLLLNFSWWINKVDPNGNNVFEGGFLGLDNITVIDRSVKLPQGALLDQVDGVGWMAMFCLNLMKMALAISKKNPVYESLATKFFEHFVYIAAAIRRGYWRGYDLFDEDEGFFYSIMVSKDKENTKLKIRSLEGLIPLFAVDIIDQEELEQHPEFYTNFRWFLGHRSHLTEKCIQEKEIDGKKHYLFSLVTADELERITNYLKDDKEFLSPYGIRSVSKYHEENPFSLDGNGISYEPGESIEKIKGGNSNWRGPIWFPTSYLLIDSLRTFDRFYGQDFQINGSSIKKFTDDLSKRLISLFLKDEKGYRPIYGTDKKLQEDQYFKDHLLFYEHYHADTGRGLGASHQTGWSALVANLIAELDY